MNNKFLFPLIKSKLPVWLKYYWYKKQQAPEPQGLLSEIITSESPITLENSLRKKFNIFNVGGNTFQQTYTGQQLYDVNDMVSGYISQEISIDNDGWISFTKENTGSSTLYLNFQSDTMNLSTNTQYAVIVELKSITATGGTLTILNDASGEQFTGSVSFSSSSSTGVSVYKRTTKASFENVNRGLRSYVSLPAGKSMTAKFRVSVIADTTVTAETFVYQPFVGGIPSPNPSYPQTVQNVSGDVVGKVHTANLFNYSNIVTNANINSSGTVISSTNININYMQVESGKTYTINSDVNRQWVYSFSNSAPNVGATGTARVVTTGTQITVQVPSGYSYLCLREDLSNDQHESNNENNTMVCEGLQIATLHLPEGFEMCKIEDYADSFVYQGSKWYKNKKIGKVVLDGSETITSNPNGTNSYFINIDGINKTSSVINTICNYFRGINYDDRAVSGDNVIYGETNQNKITVRNTTYTSIGLFTTFLSTYQPIVYYVLVTPTQEEITDTTLITDLNNLKNLYSYKGTTYISSNEPSPVFEVQYYMEGDDV